MPGIAKLCCCCFKKPTVVYTPPPPTEVERQAQAEKQPLLSAKPPVPPAGGSVATKTTSGAPGTPPAEAAVTPDNKVEETIIAPVEVSKQESKKPKAEKGDWEKELYHKLLETGTIKSAAVIADDGTVKVANFAVNPKGVKAILQAFQGDTSTIAEDGIKISDDLPVYVPGKMDAGKSIYATAVSREDEPSTGGGCVILKSKKTVVVAAYEQDVAAATRLANELMDRIRELDERPLGDSEKSSLLGDVNKASSPELGDPKTEAENVAGDSPDKVKEAGKSKDEGSGLLGEPGAGKEGSQSDKDDLAGRDGTKKEDLPTTEDMKKEQNQVERNLPDEFFMDTLEDNTSDDVPLIQPADDAIHATSMSTVQGEPGIDNLSDDVQTKGLGGLESLKDLDKGQDTGAGGIERGKMRVGDATDDIEKERNIQEANIETLTPYNGSSLPGVIDQVVETPKEQSEIESSEKEITTENKADMEDKAPATDTQMIAGDRKPDASDHNPKNNQGEPVTAEKVDITLKQPGGTDAPTKETDNTQTGDGDAAEVEGETDNKEISGMESSEAKPKGSSDDLSKETSTVQFSTLEMESSGKGSVTKGTVETEVLSPAVVVTSTDDLTKEMKDSDGQPQDVTNEVARVDNNTGLVSGTKNEDMSPVADDIDRQNDKKEEPTVETVKVSLTPEGSSDDLAKETNTAQAASFEIKELGEYSVTTDTDETKKSQESIEIEGEGQPKDVEEETAMIKNNAGLVEETENMSPEPSILVTDDIQRQVRDSQVGTLVSELETGQGEAVTAESVDVSLKPPGASDNIMQEANDIQHDAAQTEDMISGENREIKLSDETAEDTNSNGITLTESDLVTSSSDLEKEKDLNEQSMTGELQTEAGDDRPSVTDAEQQNEKGEESAKTTEMSLQPHDSSDDLSEEVLSDIVSNSTDDSQKISDDSMVVHDVEDQAESVEDISQEPSGFATDDLQRQVSDNKLSVVKNELETGRGEEFPSENEGVSMKPPNMSDDLTEQTVDSQAGKVEAVESENNSDDREISEMKVSKGNAEDNEGRETNKNTLSEAYDMSPELLTRIKKEPGDDTAGVTDGEPQNNKEEAPTSETVNVSLDLEGSTDDLAKQKDTTQSEIEEPGEGDVTKETAGSELSTEVVVGSDDLQKESDVVIVRHEDDDHSEGVRGDTAITENNTDLVSGTEVRDMLQEQLGSETDDTITEESKQSADDSELDAPEGEDFTAESIDVSFKPPGTCTNMPEDRDETQVGSGEAVMSEEDGDNKEISEIRLPSTEDNGGRETKEITSSESDLLTPSGDVQQGTAQITEPDMSQEQMEADNDDDAPSVTDAGQQQDKVEESPVQGIEVSPQDSSDNLANEIKSAEALTFEIEKSKDDDSVTKDTDAGLLPETENMAEPSISVTDVVERQVGDSQVDTLVSKLETAQVEAVTAESVGVSVMPGTSVVITQDSVTEDTDETEVSPEVTSSDDLAKEPQVVIVNNEREDVVVETATSEKSADQVSGTILEDMSPELSHAATDDVQREKEDSKHRKDESDEDAGLGADFTAESIDASLKQPGSPTDSIEETEVTQKEVKEAVTSGEDVAQSLQRSSTDNVYAATTDDSQQQADDRKPSTIDSEVDSVEGEYFTCENVEVSLKQPGMSDVVTEETDETQFGNGEAVTSEQDMAQNLQSSSSDDGKTATIDDVQRQAEDRKPSSDIFAVDTTKGEEFTNKSVEVLLKPHTTSTDMPEDRDETPKEDGEAVMSGDDVVQELQSSSTDDGQTEIGDDKPSVMDAVPENSQVESNTAKSTAVSVKKQASSDNEFEETDSTPSVTETDVQGTEESNAEELAETKEDSQQEGGDQQEINPVGNESNADLVRDLKDTDMPQEQTVGGLLEDGVQMVTNKRKSYGVDAEVETADGQAIRADDVKPHNSSDNLAEDRYNEEIDNLQPEESKEDVDTQKDASLEDVEDSDKDARETEQLVHTKDDATDEKTDTEFGEDKAVTGLNPVDSEGKQSITPPRTSIDDGQRESDQKNSGEEVFIASEHVEEEVELSPPDDFKPLHIGKEKSAPEPAPPQALVKLESQEFDSVDAHVEQVSKKDHSSFRNILWDLIHVRNTQLSEMEKARAIFLWLCSKDLSQMKFDHVEDDSPEEDLLNLRDNKTTYATVFNTLCSYAGLHCKTINGRAKGAEYTPGQRFTSDQQGHHSWNAVLVDDEWRLVDCHWASRRLVGKELDNVRYKLDEYYFMPEPEELIYTHLPDDQSWQLLPTPLSQTQFEDLVLLKSTFFKYGLYLISHKEALVTVTRQQVTISIGCPPSQESADIGFTFSLVDSTTGKDEHDGMKLNRFAMLEMAGKVHCSITVRPPAVGSYRLTVFAKKLSGSDQHGVYSGICEYQLESQQTDSKPFPPCVHTSWGPGDSLHRYNVTTTLSGAVLTTEGGNAEMRFAIGKQYRFLSKLKSNDQDDKTLQGFVMNRVVGSEAVFSIFAPNKGEFGLEIYANDPEIDGKTLSHIYQLLVVCNEDIEPAAKPLPVSSTYLGPQPLFNGLGLSTVSHSDPFLQTSENEVTIVLKVPDSVMLTSQLTSTLTNVQMSTFILQQSLPGEVHFQVRLDQGGMYKFQIYGKAKADTRPNFSGIYNYLINYTGSEKVNQVAFPVQTSQWKETCYLYSPMDGLLDLPSQPAEGYPFKVRVPGVKAVVVVVGSSWKYLEQTDSEGEVWEKLLDFSSHKGKNDKAKLLASFQEGQFLALLEYSLSG